MLGTSLNGTFGADVPQPPMPRPKKILTTVPTSQETPDADGGNSDCAETLNPCRLLTKLRWLL